VRPATALICQFIDEKKGELGVAPICRALSAHGIQIAPRTYWVRRSAAPGKRALWDTAVTEILAGIYEPGVNGRRPPESLCGTVKMWAHLNRQGIPVAKCTVERLKRAHGWRGATGGGGSAPPCRTRPQAGHRTWCAGSSRPPGPASCTWRTSPTCRWPAAGSPIQRS